MMPNSNADVTVFVFISLGVKYMPSQTLRVIGMMKVKLKLQAAVNLVVKKSKNKKTVQIFFLF